MSEQYKWMNEQILEYLRLDSLLFLTIAAVGEKFGDSWFWIRGSNRNDTRTFHRCTAAAVASPTWRKLYVCRGFRSNLRRGLRSGLRHGLRRGLRLEGGQGCFVRLRTLNILAHERQFTKTSRHKKRLYLTSVEAKAKAKKEKKSKSQMRSNTVFL